MNNTMAEGETIEEPPSEVKRGRGRPKGSKSKVLVPDTPKRDTDATELELAESALPRMKRGRGRPQGSKNKSNDTDTSTLYIEHKANAPEKARGRPRKSGSSETTLSPGVVERSAMDVNTSSAQKQLVTGEGLAEAKELKTFELFEKLPKEVQGIIWGFAFNQLPNLIEPHYDYQSQSYKSSGAASAILSLCGIDHLPKHFKPIYLNRTLYDTKHGQPASLYIRPEQDILYLSPDLLDITTFISRPENQVLRLLGLTWCDAMSFSVPTWHDSQDSLKLVSSLKLKAVYILDGVCKGKDDSMHRCGGVKWDIKLTDLPEGLPESDESEIYSALWEPGDPSPPPPRWNTGELERLKSQFEKEIQARSKWYEEPEWDAPPELIGKVVERTRISGLSSQVHSEDYDSDNDEDSGHDYQAMWDYL